MVRPNEFLVHVLNASFAALIFLFISEDAPLRVEEDGAPPPLLAPREGAAEREAEGAAGRMRREEDISLGGLFFKKKKTEKGPGPRLLPVSILPPRSF
jgi:hypothetical protein